MKYNNLVFIGRFQPFHVGHKAVVDKALEMSEHVTIVIGSHDAPPNVRNPFTSFQRQQMIRNCYQKDKQDRIRFVNQVDHTYNFDRWIAGVQSGVGAAEASYGWSAGPTPMGLIGFNKDASSFYLKAFPAWDRVDVPELAKLNATEIREDYFKMTYKDFKEKHSKTLPVAVMSLMGAYSTLPEHEHIRSEFMFINDYKKQWEASPYPPTFVTVDAIVVQAGHVLLVRRGALPGKGLLALPGGFINQHEAIEDAVLRELREETRIAVPLPVLKGSITARRVFDDPWRSQRGRTITHAHLIKLNDENPLPKVKGSDDADKAFWVPFSDLRRNNMYEDHFDMLEAMIGI